VQSFWPAARAGQSWPKWLPISYRAWQRLLVRRAPSRFVGVFSHDSAWLWQKERDSPASQEADRTPRTRYAPSHESPCLVDRPRRRHALCRVCE
jgi:hypothetical protein